jgi:hypothetical protein
VPKPIYPLINYAQSTHQLLVKNKKPRFLKFQASLVHCERLNLSNNSLSDVGANVRQLPRLRHLNVSHNGIEHVHDWHLLLGQVTHLYLANNTIRSLAGKWSKLRKIGTINENAGLQRVKSLELLDVSNNALMDVVEVWPVGDLPVLTQLTLTGNPVAATIEYRTRVLQAFGTRANEVIFVRIGNLRKL